MTSFPPPCLRDRRFYLAMQLLSLSLLYLPNGLGWYFGNLAVYLNSWSFMEQDSTSFLSSWVISVYMICRSVTMILLGFLVKKVNHRRLFLLLGVLVFDSGVFLSYFTVKMSQLAMVVTYGGMSGIGYGFIQTEILTRLPKLVSKRRGLAFAFVNNFMTVGAVFFDWMITWYVNASNREARVLVASHYKVFNHRSVVERVPFVFILLGAGTSLCHVSGLVLSFILKDKGGPEMICGANNNEVSKTKALGEAKESTSLSQDMEDNANRAPDMLRGIMAQSSPSKLGNSLGVNKDRISHDTNKNSQSLPIEKERRSDPHTYTPGPVENCNKASTAGHLGDLNQVQMLKTVTFYVLWFGLFANDASYVFLLNFYKVFGQLWIHDDHFLTHLGMASLITVISMRIVWALIMDYFGIKNTLIILCSSMAVTFAFYFFAPQINPYLFGVLTSAMTALCSAVYIVFPMMTLELFGQTCFAGNYGLVATCNIFLNLFAPQTATALVHHFGWSALFLSTSALNVLAAIGAILGLRGRHKE